MSVERSEEVGHAAAAAVPAASAVAAAAVDAAAGVAAEGGVGEPAVAWECAAVAVHHLFQRVLRHDIMF